jgi:hypothetical protein
MSARRPIFAPLQGTERDSAANAIARANLDLAEFVLEERRTEQIFARGNSVVHKLISIRRVTTGAQRQYSTGRGGGWPFEFERDLRLGFYDRPWPSAPGYVAEARR